MGLGEVSYISNIVIKFTTGSEFLNQHTLNLFGPAIGVNDLTCRYEINNSNDVWVTLEFSYHMNFVLDNFLVFLRQALSLAFGYFHSVAAVCRGVNGKFNISKLTLA